MEPVLKSRCDGLGGGGGEARPLLTQQRPASVAVRHPRPEGPRREKVLRKVLRRIHRPYQCVLDRSWHGTWSNNLGNPGNESI